MANDLGGNLYDFDGMSDDEIRSVVLEHIRDYPNLDADDVDVLVRDGAVTLTGRVGSDAEVQIASSLLDDLLGLEQFSNELMVDELRRGEDDGETTAMGDPGSYQSDTAEHLVEDLEAETYGTDDMGKAIRDGSPYSPPDAPSTDGYGSREDH